MMMMIIKNFVENAHVIFQIYSWFIQEKNLIYATKDGSLGYDLVVSNEYLKLILRSFVYLDQCSWLILQSSLVKYNVF